MTQGPAIIFLFKFTFYTVVWTYCNLYGKPQFNPKLLYKKHLFVDARISFIVLENLRDIGLSENLITDSIYIYIYIYKEKIINYFLNKNIRNGYFKKLPKIKKGKSSPHCVFFDEISSLDSI